MYDVDDAVAKIDGYIISIAGAASEVGSKRMVRIDQVGRTAASAFLLDEAGEIVRPPARTSSSRGSARGGRRASGAGEGGRAGERARSRARGRRAPADSEGADARREAGLHETPTAVDSEPEDEVVAKDVAGESPGGEGDADDLQSKPRRRGRRGGRRRSAAKAKATPE
jgi:ribonuclease G